MVTGCAAETMAASRNFRVVVRNVDMPEEQEQEAIEIAAQVSSVSTTVQPFIGPPYTQIRQCNQAGPKDHGARFLNELWQVTENVTMSVFRLCVPVGRVSPNGLLCSLHPISNPGIKWRHFAGGQPHAKIERAPFSYEIKPFG